MNKIFFVGLLLSMTTILATASFSQKAEAPSQCFLSKLLKKQTSKGSHIDIYSRTKRDSDCQLSTESIAAQFSFLVLSDMLTPFKKDLESTELFLSLNRGTSHSKAIEVRSPSGFKRMHTRVYIQAGIQHKNFALKHFLIQFDVFSEEKLSDIEGGHGEVKVYLRTDPPDALLYAILKEIQEPEDPTKSKTLSAKLYI